ncbi:hypothetical protein [Bifidobacterium scardovii]|jgi:hypothetical protein|uniref:hypothetical protein n=1 Tax=Bifidobacterium scardovii TaxID=158787 RepID=UPI000669A61F|nr:hypothetical protein [Bifidobacterium scardovii]MBS6948504.1 hypothetical protein [Bifidobacterium scardovii]MDU3737518.1 hypothetical protein [Bifidobacterium scardovii]MDU5610246.1 hypothetical protein [Bifidobacterium scardovii]DAO75346.1 MAG TPA: hypothetical protein [Caudoviricetes sp.]
MSDDKTNTQDYPLCDRCGARHRPDDGKRPDIDDALRMILDELTDQLVKDNNTKPADTTKAAPRLADDEYEAYQTDILRAAFRELAEVQDEAVMRGDIATGIDMLNAIRNVLESLQSMRYRAAKPAPTDGEF